DCARCGLTGPHQGFVPALGGVVCAQCRPPGCARPQPQTLELLAALVEGDWAATTSADARTRREASGLVSAYTTWHLERGLRSLPLVERG
ncbi:MAG TPA: DNA repair protein RecO C-terminal domain-containing protein, partial [Candidatus Avipropionibacterium avicola]|nr:DNA repair protein RecO C-terminal domain-containing protein [Candidatus Avipropionibacterium avicola]